MAENAPVDHLVVVLLLAPVAYLLGTFPSAALVARRAGRDVMAEGSGNPVASNIVRLMGWKAGAVVFALDALKGALAAGVGLAIDGHTGAYILGIAAILGHMWPVTRRFKGGRGVATGAGVLVVIFPVITVLAIVVWLAVARLTHKASVASLVVTVGIPISVALAGHSWSDIVVISAMALVVIARHLSSLRRLVRGEEPDLDRPGNEPPDVGDERAAS